MQHLHTRPVPSTPPPAVGLADFDPRAPSTEGHIPWCPCCTDQTSARPPGSPVGPKLTDLLAGCNLSLRPLAPLFKPRGAPQGAWETSALSFSWGPGQPGLLPLPVPSDLDPFLTAPVVLAPSGRWLVERNGRPRHSQTRKGRPVGPCQAAGLHQKVMNLPHTTTRAPTEEGCGQALSLSFRDAIFKEVPAC